MAISQTHFRSISLPSTLQSTPTADFESDLQKLKSFQVSANSAAIQSGLLRMAQLCNSVEEIAQSQQKSIFLDDKSMEESLSWSVELLDYCSYFKELLQTMKENVQALQSTLRRKGSVQNDVGLYFRRRKRMNKSAAETLKALKKSHHDIMKSGCVERNFSSVFRKVKAAMIAIFKSVVVFLCLSKTKVMMIKKCGDDDESEVGNLELNLKCLRKMRSVDGTRVVDVQKRLHNVEVIVEGFEGGLERLFRQLVRIRVTLLNILTDN